MDPNAEHDDTETEGAAGSWPSPVGGEDNVGHGIDDVPVSEPAVEPRDLTAGAPVREEELDQVHQKIPDTHQF